MTHTTAAAGPFSGNVCVVTGAGSGIGRALALELALRGARLALSDIDAAALSQTVAMVSANAAEVTGEQLDVADRAAVFAHAEAVRERFGAVDTVFNNAGVALAGDVAQLRIEDFQWLMDINFWGVVHGSQAFLPALVDSGRGRLVNISSVFGLIAVPGQGAYNAAKFAVRGFTEALRQEQLMAGSGVCVSCVLPGGVRTNIARSARTYTGESAQQRDAAFTKLARTSATRAAQIIVRGAMRGDARILVGVDARIIDAVTRVLGPGYQQLVYRLAKLAPR